MLSMVRVIFGLFRCATNRVPDFVPYFRSTSEAVSYPSCHGIPRLIRCDQHEAFNLFDKDGNGDISKKEMRDAVQRIYRERKALIAGLKVNKFRLAQKRMTVIHRYYRMSAQPSPNLTPSYWLWYSFSSSLYACSYSTVKTRSRLWFRLPQSSLAFRSFLGILLSFCLNLYVRSYDLKNIR